MKKPNILWLLAEDMCPNLGCYGDADAITPNLDQLANEGTRYDHVSSCGPVCSAARTTLALGMYPPSVGTGNHRSHVKLPPTIKLFAEYMQEAGYYTAINKTDYNFQAEYIDGVPKGFDDTFKAKFFEDSEAVPKAIKDQWDKAGDKPFFFMHTYAVTHQSKYGFPNTPEAHRAEFIPRTTEDTYRDRDKLHIPSYHPDNSDTREIWGQYHECVTAMDRMVGETIDLLKADGLYEDTIIFFFGDNGMGIPSGKFNMWHEGTSVPLIIRVPEKYQDLATNYEPSSVSNMPITFVDFAKTALSLATAKVPDYMHGDNILNDQKTLERTASLSYRNRIDSSSELVRSLKDDRYLYIRNFYPQKGWRYSPYIGISSPYFMTSWDKAVEGCDQSVKAYNRLNAYNMSRKPVEELYDLSTDPDQMNNLAGDLNQLDQLLSMRVQVVEEMLKLNDGGLMPEQVMMDYAKSATAYEVIHNRDLYPLEEILDACNKMLDPETPIAYYESLLKHDNPSMRYWGVQGIYASGSIDLGMLEPALADNSASVRLAAAETVVMLSVNDNLISKAKSIIKECLNNKTDILIPLEAIDCLDRLGKKAIDLIPETKHLMDREDITIEPDMDRYIAAITSLAKFYPEKMGKPHKYNDDEVKYNERLYEYRRLSGC